MRWHAMRLPSREWIHRDLPLRGAAPTWSLSGAGQVRATIEPQVEHLQALRPWAVALFGEESGQIRWGGVVTATAAAGQQLTVTADELTVYPHGIPYIETYRRIRVDPLDVVRHLWRHMQSFPDGDLGVTVDDTASPVVLGESGNLFSPNVASGTDHLATTDGFVSDDATLSSSAATADAGLRSLKCDMGPSHGAGAEIFQTYAFRIRDHDAVHKFYASLSTGGTEPNEDFEVTVQAIFYDASAGPDTEGVVSAPDTFRIPKGGSFAQVEWTHIDPRPFPGAVYLSISVTSTSGDTDPMSVWADNLTLTTGEEQQAYELAWWETPDVGTEIDKLAAETPFDYRADHEWVDADKSDVASTLVLGYPRLGRRQHHLRFVEGENIAEVAAVTSNGDGYAGGVVVLGAGEGRRRVGVRVFRRDPGRLRRVVVVEDSSISTRERARRLGRRELNRRDDVAAVESLTVWDHPHAPLGSFHVGDDILVRAHVGWADTEIWSRITDYTYNEADDVVRLDLARSDTFDYGQGADTVG